jgi:nitric oxide reductase large subunit
VFLCGVVLLAERRSGGIITLLGSLFAAGMPVIHLMGPRLGQVDNYGAAFFFLWTLIALGVTGMFSAILAARELWSFKRAR